jgi:hypothetical protein
MRIVRLTCFIASLACILLGLPAGDVWHPTQPVPAICSAPEFEAILIDVSRSMKRGGLFEQVQQDVDDYIMKKAPACTLSIVGSFGMTADVKNSQFLVNLDSRTRLVAAVHSLRPTQTSTNLDEAAKLIELLSYQLRAAYGTPANQLVVRLYSDFESSPSNGKPNFSLGEYLAHRMDAKYLHLSSWDGPAERTVRLQTGHADDDDRKVRSPEPKKTPLSILSLAVAGCAALLGSLIALVWLRSRSPNVGPRAGALRALLVNESAVGHGEGDAAAVSPERRVDVAAGVPAVFSTDANSATYVAAVIPAADNGELFRIEPLPDDSVRVQSRHSRLTVNDEPIGVERHMKVDIREPIRILLGPREFNIIGVFGRPQVSERGDNVFDAEPLQH